MARYLSTVPTNHGFVNLGLVEAYPTGGTGPTAYGPTSYFGSDPLPAIDGDSINTPINLGSLTPLFKEIPITGTHGGLSRKQSSFYKFKLLKPRAIQVTQDFSQFSYQSNTNRNTLIAFYRVENGTHRNELAVNDNGYVINNASIDANETDIRLTDYPTQQLDAGDYLFVITNDIRYQETTFAITITSFNIDWRFTSEAALESIELGAVTESAASELDFGSLVAA